MLLSNTQQIAQLNKNSWQYALIHLLCALIYVQHIPFYLIKYQYISRNYFWQNFSKISAILYSKINQSACSQTHFCKK